MTKKRFGKVYAVFFNDGWVKVGKSMQPESRLQPHIFVSRMRGADLVEMHISKPLIDYSAAEAALIGYCAEKYTKAVGSEWFSNVNREELKNWMNSVFIEIGDEEMAAIKADDNSELSDAMDKALGITEFKRWGQSVRMANVLEQLYLGDFYGWPIFEQKDGAWSQFKLSASITIHQLGDEEIADLFSICVTDPMAGLNIVFGKTVKAIQAFKAHCEESS